MDKVKPLNISNLGTEYPNKWVALLAETGEVVASGKSLKEVQKEVSTDKKNLTFLLVLSNEFSFAPLVA